MRERVAVVTGGAKGIGAAVTNALAAAGLRVVAVGRDTDALTRLVSEQPVTDHRITTLECDVTREASVTETFRRVGVVDVLVNNAGIAMANPVHRTSLADWDEQMRVNATAAFLCIRAVLPGMRERGWGRIVTIASTAGLAGAPYVAAYTASKHAVLGLTRAVAAEIAGAGVTANSVCPTFVRTEMTARTLKNIMQSTGRSAETAESDLVARSPLGRLLEPEEVSAAVAYLVSDSAAAVNGQCIVLDGGGIQL